MTVLEHRCPQCGHLPDAPVPPPDSGDSTAAVLTCPLCGFLGIWDVHYWRRPTDTERSALLSVSSVAESQFNHLWLSMCQDSDIERAYYLLVDRLAPILYTAAGLSALECATLLRRVCTDLSREGFHTHHEPITLKEDL